MKVEVWTEPRNPFQPWYRRNRYSHTRRGKRTRITIHRFGGVALRIERTTRRKAHEGWP